MKHYCTISLCLIGLSSQIILWSAVSWVNFSWKRSGWTAVYIKLVQYLWAKILICVEKPADPWCTNHRTDCRKLSEQQRSRQKFKINSMFTIISGTFTTIFCYRVEILLKVVPRPPSLPLPVCHRPCFGCILQLLPWFFLLFLNDMW